jgi:regulator of sigma E protease
MIDSLLGQVSAKLYTGAAFLVVLGIIIFVHEFGHFLTAKLFGMRVFIFSFGFGKRLFGLRRGGTDYRVSLVPLGGYVKLEGEEDDFLSESTAKEGDGRDFLARPRWQRFLVYLAGPLMNAVLTAAVLAGFYMIGVYEPSEQQARPIIGAVQPGLPAQQAGLGAGDEVVAIDGQPIAHWEDLQFRVALAPNRVLHLKVEREGVVRAVDVRPVPSGPDRTGRIGAAGLVYVLALPAGWPAEAAGLKVDDALVSIEGKSVYTVQELAAVVKAGGGRPMTLRVFRGGHMLDLVAKPEDRGNGFQLGIGDLGPQRVLRRLAPLPALVAGLQQTGKLTRQVVDILGGLVTGRVSFRLLGGPIRIAQESGQAARQGGSAYLGFIAFISINVGILNLFPLIPLDGGHMLLLAVEGVMRRNVSVRVKTWLMNAGAAAVLLLIVVVLFFDLAKTGAFGSFRP